MDNESRTFNLEQVRIIVSLCIFLAHDYQEDLPNCRSMANVKGNVLQNLSNLGYDLGDVGTWSGG